MSNVAFHLSVFTFVVGATVVFAIFIKVLCQRIGIPALIGYLALGFLLRLADIHWQLLSDEDRWIYEFFANLGVIVLLFRVGLESNLSRLLGQLRRASLIWIGNILGSGLFGYVVSHYLLGIALIPSLFVAVTLTATSLGVSVSVWQEAQALQSSNGALLLDVAELDDISGVLLIALLLAVAPILHGSIHASFFPIFMKTTALLLISLLAFGALCYFFSRYLEQPFTQFFSGLTPSPDPMLIVTGTAFMISAFAGMLGFSVAIGAFFAGLVFSRDPQAVTIDASFGALYQLFSPFFFISVGLHIDPSALTAAIDLGVILLIAAVVGKIIGTCGPALLTMTWKSSMLLGISMIPRAEIAMVIMQQGRQLGPWAVSSHVFAAMVLVSAVTCLAAPLLLQPLLHRWQPPREEWD